MNVLRWILFSGTALVAFGAAVAVFFFLRSARQANGRPADDAAPPGAAWRAEVLLEQLSEQSPSYEANRLTIVLRDSKGREIETPDIGFQLDGVPLTYRVGQGNYYDGHPYFRLDEDSGFRFAPDTLYPLAVRKAGGVPSPFAELRTPKAMSLGDFDLPKARPSGRDLTLAWKSLSQPAEVLIYRTFTSTDASGNETVEAGGPYGEDVLRHRIGAGDLPLPAGRLTVPAKYLESSEGRSVTALGIEISTSDDGRFLHPVLRGSAITARRKIMLRVDVVSP